MAADDKLTLEALGVDIRALADRLGRAQDASNRDDDACASIAGVSAERWASWKSARIPPGVARMPKIAEAVAASVPFLMFGVGEATAGALSDALDFARLSARLITEITPHVDALVQLCAEVKRTGAPIVDGALMSRLLMNDVCAVLERYTPAPTAYIRDHE